MALPLLLLTTVDIEGRRSKQAAFKITSPYTSTPDIDLDFSSPRPVPRAIVAVWYK